MGNLGQNRIEGGGGGAMPCRASQHPATVPAAGFAADQSAAADVDSARESATDVLMKAHLYCTVRNRR